MTLALEPIVGSTKVVVLAPDRNVTRGAAAEFRHFGYSVVLRVDILAALTEVLHDSTAMLVISADVPCHELRDVIDLAVATCGSSVLLGLTGAADPKVISAAMRAGVRGTVDLPLVPARMARDLRAAPVHSGSGPVSAGPLTVDPARFSVAWNGIPVTVTPREFGVLLVLARHYPEMATLDELARSYLGNATDPYAAVRVVITHLRSRFTELVGSTAAPTIETIRGLGYRLPG